MTEDEEFEALEQRLNMKETKQPEALRLADELEYDWNLSYASAAMWQAATELRRLHALNQELLEALNKCSAQLTRLGYSANHADAAIAKAQGASNE